MTSRFDCDVVGNMDEYVGCKIDRDWENRLLKITQPVMIQSFADEFNTDTGRRHRTPAESGQLLSRCAEGQGMKREEQKVFRSGVGKLLHMMRWTRPDVLNAVRELSKFMKEATQSHLKAMICVMAYVMSTPK